MENINAATRARNAAQTAAPKYAKRLNALADDLDTVHGMLAEAKRRAAIDGQSFLRHYAQIMEAR